MHKYTSACVFNVSSFFCLCACLLAQVAKLSTLAWVRRCISSVKDTETQLVNLLLEMLCTVSNMM